MIRFSLITPEKVVYNGEADSVSIPTATGQIQVLMNHVPLVAMLAPGELQVKHAGETVALAVSSGYVEVRPGNEVVVLANTAERAHEIDVDRAEAAKLRARALLSEKIASDTEYAQVFAALEKEFARVRVARKHATRHRPAIGQE